MTKNRQVFEGVSLQRGQRNGAGGGCQRRVIRALPLPLSSSPSSPPTPSPLLERRYLGGLAMERSERGAAPPQPQ